MKFTGIDDNVVTYMKLAVIQLDIMVIWISPGIAKFIFLHPLGCQNEGQELESSCLFSLKCNVVSVNVIFCCTKDFQEICHDFQGICYSITLLYFYHTLENFHLGGRQKFSD